MALTEVNVEFGKCSLKDESRLSQSEEETKIISERSIHSGSIYFDEHRADSKHIPFILTSYSVDMHEFYTKLLEDWNLPLPRIILFAVGETEDSLSDEYRKMSKKLVKGLVHALNTTEMWLCTDGLNRGFSKDVGKAFENEFSRRKSLEKGIQNVHSVFPETALIGICSRNILTFSDKFGEPKMNENIQEVTKIKNDINRRYGYFIIVDDTTETGNGVWHFILKFAEHIANHGLSDSDPADSEKNEIKSEEIPVMALLLHGTTTQINLILGHLKLGLPLVVFEGSGGLADLLAYAYYQAIYQPEGINIAEYTESVLKPQVSDKVREMHPLLSDYEVILLTEKIFDCIRYSKKRDQEFITIIDLNDIEVLSYKLPHYFLKALFKSQTSETMKGVHQMKQDLFLAMDWNSADVAKEEVFSRDPTSRFQIDGEIFFRALTKPHREDFISLFLNQGFTIHTFLDSSALLKLFENSLNREFFRNVVWESVLGFGTNVDISRTFLDTKLIVLIEELTGIPAILNSYELDWNSRLIYDDRTPQEAERKAVTVLVLWAILSYRVQAVKTLWRHSEQPIHLALACSIILRKLESFVNDLSLKNEMEKYSKEFSVMAANVMTLCYERVSCRALDLLDEKNSVWSHKALMEMAAFSKNKMFLAHPCCQKYLDNIFMGKFKVRDLPYGDITIPLWMKIILSSFLIFPMYLWVRFEAPKSKYLKTRNLKNSSTEKIGISESKEQEIEAIKVQEKISKEPGFFGKIYYFWSAPISKFWICQVFYLLFLICFSLAVIWPGCGNLYLDFFTCLWIAIIIIDSIYHAYTLNKKYTSMPLAYKCTEISLMIIFLFCYAMGRLILPFSFMSPYSVKVMLCYALLYFYYRLIFIALPISAELGPLLYRVKRMTVVDFTSYIRVTILVIVSNGIAIHATIYPDYPLNWELARKAFFDAIISFFLTPADHFGTPDMKCIRLWRGKNKISFIGTPENVCKVGRYFKPTCPNPGVWPYIIGLQYLIILRLIAVVMLFALFSNTARKLEEEGKYIWQYQRYALITNFSNRLTLPPPLCIISFIYMICNHIHNKVSSYIKRSNAIKPEDDSHALDKLDENDFRYWKSLAMQYYKNTQQEKAKEITTKTRMDRIHALACGLNNQRKSLGELGGNLKQLQIELKNAHQYLEGTGLQASIRERLIAKSIPQIFSRISPYPNTMISRFPVSDSHVSWQCNWIMYNPIAYTMQKDDFPPALRPHVDVDIQRLREIEGDEFRMPKLIWNTTSVSPGGVCLDRQSWITDTSNRTFTYELDSENLPKNPLGRTGLKGRGCLPRWGPNHYIYTIITRWYESEIFSNYLEGVLMNTRDGLCLPGGYVHTENRYIIIHSLFRCDKVWRDSDDMVQFFYSLKRHKVGKRTSSSTLTEEEFTSERVKLGYMDEEINTDQAWCEAEVWHFHYNVKSDIEDVFKADMRWYTLSEETLAKVPIGQSALIHTITKKMEAALEIM